MAADKPAPTVQRRAAYFTMEIALKNDIPTYSGGLGVLSGDTIRSMADLEAPVVAVSLCHRKGYFTQHISADGTQSEQPMVWDPATRLKEVGPRIDVPIAGRTVKLRAWQFPVEGAGGGSLPVLLLDADLPENTEADRRLTDQLYGGDPAHRLAQELLLGVGGVRMLRAAGYADLEVFHLNEGHASLIVLALLDELAKEHPNATTAELLPALRERCVFTTHTPVPAGHDRFPRKLVDGVLTEEWRKRLDDLDQTEELHMTKIALKTTRYVNGVALKHGEVTRTMFPDAKISSITNGVHLPTWASVPMQNLFDAHAPGWRVDPNALRNIVEATDDEIWSAHLTSKQALVDRLTATGHKGFDREALTLVWARRATGYKRPGLLFDNPERLRSMAKYIGPLQIVCAGKAHPKDEEGKSQIHRIHEVAKELSPVVPVAFIENYDMDIARLLVSGGDVWVNTPRPPLEASGTSGMKAAVNGVPSLSILDGWWIEGHLEHKTGWAIAEYVVDSHKPENDKKTAHALYEKLSKQILPCYVKARPEFIAIMRNAIAYNGTFFNTHRMVQQYLLHAYRMAPGSSALT